MSKIFIEYKISEPKRDLYLTFMKEMIKKRPDLEWYEGTDQRGLFIEIWNNVSCQAYSAFKEERLYLENEWREIDSCISGGKEQIHLWHFTALG